MADFDIVIRGGTIIDGSGKPGYEADIAIRDGTIEAIGTVLGSGVEEIDARDLIVTPGFVDVHTHYDGQATWENTLQPSSGHGVTTVIAGNCGVGFAPCRPADRETLVKVMEGVEDIPEIVMVEGLPWNWESFPEYLDALAARKLDVDIGAQLPHSPLRVYVMGRRGADHEPAIADELAEMRRLTTEAIEAGAIGVTTSRLHFHRAKTGELAPSIDSADEELLALAGGLRDAGKGVFQMIADVDRTPRQEFGLMRALAEMGQAPLSFTLLQRHSHSLLWREFLDEIEDAQGDGLMIRGQVFPRPVGVMQGLGLTLNPFSLCPSYKAIADRPLDEKVRIMRDPAFKTKLLAETPDHDANPMFDMLTAKAGELFPMSDPPNYAPSPEETVAGRARISGRSPLDIAYDLLLEQDGRAVLYLPASNFAGGRLDAVRAMIEHPGTILGLGDGGAHYGFICDASYPTTMLCYWARDVEAKQRLTIEAAVKMLSHEPALAVCLNDRGLLAPDYKADINVIDHRNLRMFSPQVRYDLPSGGRRISQEAVGYAATIVSGVVTYRNGIATGALPGRLIRGQQGVPVTRRAADIAQA